GALDVRFGAFGPLVSTDDQPAGRSETESRSWRNWADVLRPPHPDDTTATAASATPAASSDRLGAIALVPRRPRRAAGTFSSSHSATVLPYFFSIDGKYDAGPFTFSAIASSSLGCH